MSKTYILSFLLTLFLISNSKCQENKYKFEHITITDGLPQSTIYSILQDHNGYFWFGTQDKGLCKYDGYSFKVFNHDPFAENSISSNKISHIIEDRNGIIWVGSWGGGLNKLNPETEEFVVYKNDPGNPASLSHDKAQYLFIDKDSNLWIGTAGGGISKFNEENETFENYRHTVTNLNSISDNRVWCISQDNKGYLWIGTDFGLNRFNPKTGLFEAFLNNPNNISSISHSQVRQIFNDKEGTLWIGTAIGLDKYLPESKSFKRFPYSDENKSKNSVNIIYEDKFRNLWVGTHIGGLKKFDKKSGQFQSFTNDPENKNTISYDDVRDIVLDNTNVLWVATRGGGLNKLDLKPQKFQHLAHQPKNKNSLLNDRVKSIYEDKNGILWIGTDIGGGLNKYDRENNKFTHYRHNSLNSNSISSNDITTITEDKEGFLWLGTDGFGIDRFDPVKENFKHFKNDPENTNSLCFNEIWDIQQDNDGYIWIGTNDGLDKYDPVNDQFIHYKKNKKDSSSLSDKVVWVIYCDSEKNIWAGTDNGLNLYDKKSDTFKRYMFNTDRSNGLTNSSIYSIYEDKNKTLWIGTENGLHRFNKEDDTFNFYPEFDSKLSRAIFGILSDKSGNIWMSTVNGLTQFNTTTTRHKSYDIYDGLQNNDYNIGACCESKTGELMFGGVNGLNIFYPDSVKDNPFIPPIVITDFKLFNKSLLPGSKKLEKIIDATKAIKLKYNENFFSIGFSALNYTKNTKNQYACMLEGFDENWIDLGYNRYKHYTNIPAGEYIFKIRGSNNDGIWNLEGRSLLITVTPPFWKTVWFIIIEIGLIILIVIGIIKWREKSLILSKIELAEIVKERTLELSDQKEELETALALISKQKDGLKEANLKIQENTKIKEEFLAKTSHELRTPLNVIVGFANLLLNEQLDQKHQSYLREIKASTDNLLVVIDDILTFSKIESGKLNIEVIEFDLKETIKTIFHVFSIKAKRKGVDYINNTDNSIPDFVYGAPVRLNQIISNLIDNAIKFTEKDGKVSLKANCIEKNSDSTKIEIIVEDTGIGMDLDSYKQIFESFSQASNDTTRKFGGTGLGLSIVKRLVELLDGSIEVESKPNVGTRFRILLNFKIGKGDNLNNETTNYKIDKTKKLKNISILLVDDNVINKILASDTIKLYNSNIQIDTAENGKDALEKMDKKDYDLIILDIQMPVMDGYETAKYIRGSFTKPKSDVPILGMSAHALEEEKEKCFALGMNEYITKPFIPDELFKKIDTLTKHIETDTIIDDIEEIAEYKYIDLKNLVSIYGEDKNKIDNIVGICFENIPKQLIDLNESIIEEDYKSIQVISHSLKTSFNYLGLENLKTYSQNIENFAIKKGTKEEIETNNSLITNNWKNVEAELKEYIENKKG